MLKDGDKVIADQKAMIESMKNPEEYKSKHWPARSRDGYQTAGGAPGGSAVGWLIKLHPTKKKAGNVAGQNQRHAESAEIR